MRKKIILFVLIIFLSILSCRLSTPDGNLQEIKDQTKTVLLPIKSATVSPTTSPTVTKTSIPLPELSLIDTLGEGTAQNFLRSPDGSKIFLSDGENIEVLDGTTYEVIKTIPSIGSNYSYVSNVNHDGSLLIISGMFGFSVLELESGEVIGSGSGGMGSTSGEIFSNNEQFIVYSSNAHNTGETYHQICRIDLSGEILTGEDAYYGDCFPTFDNNRYTTTSNPAISPNGKWVAAGYHDRTRKVIFIWDIKTKEIIQQIEQQPIYIRGVVFSPDSTQLASIGDDGVIRFWNVTSGKLIKTITIPSVPNYISSIHFSKNGKQLIFYGWDQNSTTYDISTGKISSSPPDPIDPYLENQLNNGYVLDGSDSFVRFSPSGEKFANGDGSIQVWDTKSKSILSYIYTDRPLKLVGMAFSNHEDLLAAATKDGKVYVWDIESGEQLFLTQTGSLSDRLVHSSVKINGTGPAIGGNTYEEYDISFSNDDKQILIPNDGNIDIWDIESTQKQSTLEVSDPLLSPFKISVSDDGKYVYSVMNRNQNMVVWDKNTGQQIDFLSFPEVADDVFTATDLSGKWFARNNAKDGEYWIEAINFVSGETVEIPTSERVTEPIRFSNNGKFIGAVISSTLTIWDTETGKLIFIFTEPSIVSDFAIDDQTGILATTYMGKVSLWDLTPYIDLSNSSVDYPMMNTPEPTPTPDYDSWYDTPTPMPTIVVETLQVPYTSANAINEKNSKNLKLIKTIGLGEITDISQGVENTLFVTTQNGLFELDADTLEILQTIEKEGITISDYKQMADGSLWVAGNNSDLHSFIWNNNSSEPFFEFDNTLRPVISPNGKWVVLSTSDGVVVPWNLETNTRAKDWDNYYEEFSKIIFSPNSKLVAAISDYDYVRIWDIENGTILNSVGGSEGPINDIQFSADSKYLVGAAGGEAWIWNVNPNVAPKSIVLYEPIYKDNQSIFFNQTTAIAMNPNNTVIAVGTNKREIHLYNAISGLQTKTITDLTSTPNKILFSADGHKIIVSDVDSQISIVNINTNETILQSHIFSGKYEQLIPRLDGNMGTWIDNIYYIIDTDTLSIVDSTYVPTNHILAGDPTGNIILGYEPYQVSMFNEANGQLIKTLPETSEEVFVDYFFQTKILQQFYGALFNHSGNEFFTFGTGGIWQYTSPDGELLNYLEGNNSQKAALSMDDKWLIASPNDYGWPAFLIDLEDTASINGFSKYDGRYFGSPSINHPQYIFHPDKNSILVFENGYEISVNGEKTIYPPLIKMVNTSSLEIEAEISISEHRPIHAAFSPNGKVLAVGTDDGTILLLDGDTLEIYKQWNAHMGSINALAFTNNGEQLFSAGLEGTIKVWGVE